LHIKYHEKVKQSLCAMPGMSKQEILEDLEKVEPPYGLQTVLQEINAQRTWVESGQWE
jgi:hypothetical protein